MQAKMTRIIKVTLLDYSRPETHKYTKLSAIVCGVVHIFAFFRTISIRRLADSKLIPL